MAYSFIQKISNSGTPSASSIATANLGSNPTSSNLFFYVANLAASLTTAVLTDTRLNNFVEIGTHFDSTVGDAFHFGYAKNISGGAIDAFLCTFGASVPDPALYIAEYSGLEHHQLCIHHWC